MLMTSIFSFSHNVFCPIKDRNHHFSNIEFIVSKCFQFGLGQNSIVWERVNSLPNDTILGSIMFEFKANADDKFDVAEIMGFVFERVENIVGKGENAGYQHFLLFPQCFQKTSFPGLLKVGMSW